MARDKLYGLMSGSAAAVTVDTKLEVRAACCPGLRAAQAPLGPSLPRSTSGSDEGTSRPPSARRRTRRERRPTNDVGFAAAEGRPPSPTSFQGQPSTSRHTSRSTALDGTGSTRAVVMWKMNLEGHRPKEHADRR